MLPRVRLHGDPPPPPLPDVYVLEWPEVDHQHDVGPEVAKHLGDHRKSPLEGTGEAVLVPGAKKDKNIFLQKRGGAE